MDTGPMDDIMLKVTLIRPRRVRCVCAPPAAAGLWRLAVRIVNGSRCHRRRPRQLGCA
jgi:hypothetical protein